MKCKERPYPRYVYSALFHSSSFTFPFNVSRWRPSLSTAVRFQVAIPFFAIQGSPLLFCIRETSISCNYCSGSLRQKKEKKSKIGQKRGEISIKMVEKSDDSEEIGKLCHQLFELYGYSKDRPGTDKGYKILFGSKIVRMDGCAADITL